MNKELIMPTEISLKDKKNLVKGHVIRAALLGRIHVADVQIANHERYYLIFYKNNLIYGEKLDQIEEDSFIHKAFRDGITVDSPHPILKSLIPSQTVTIPNKNKLFQQLQLHYSLQEMAYIATTLDSFYDKEVLVKILDKIFFHYRRSGSFIKSFQTLQILTEFVPSLKSAAERLNSHEFHTYRDFYQTSSLASIQKKDPLYVELHCFQNRSNPEKHSYLENILKEQHRYAEVVLLWLEKAEASKKVESIESYTKIALQAVTLEEWIFILGVSGINPYKVLPEARGIIEQMVQKSHYERAAMYLLKFIHDLPEEYEGVLNTLWENLNAAFVVTHLEKFIFMFQQQVDKNHSNFIDQRIFQLAVILYEEYDPKDVLEKLLPLQNLFPDSTVMGKVKRMAGLLEDPDRMMELGDFYGEFKQYDKAIDCFFWEMELKPQDPIPVQKISRMYQHKGLVKEAANYQKVYLQLKSNQGVG